MGVTILLFIGNLRIDSIIPVDWTVESDRNCIIQFAWLGSSAVQTKSTTKTSPLTLQSPLIVKLFGPSLRLLRLATEGLDDPFQKQKEGSLSH